MRIKITAITAVTAAAFAIAAAPAGAATPYPVASEPQMYAQEAAFVLTGQDPAQSPPGVNVPGCRPSPAHPDPVVLVHGLNGNQYNGFAGIGPTLANAGYCVYSLNYGNTTAFDGGTAPLATSVPQIAAFITQIAATSSTGKVDLVGHSEGGFMVEYVPKVVPGIAAKVARIVALAPPSHGTALFGLAYLVQGFGLGPVVSTACGACADLLVGSDGINTLDDGPIAQPGIAYTTIISKLDEAITPYTSAAIDQPGVHNVVVQDVCPFDPVGHTGLAYDSGVATMIKNGLDPAHPAPVSCAFGPIG